MIDDIAGRARILRTLRAWTGLEQKDVAAGMGLGVATIRRAEIEEACSDKSWAAALGYYRTAHGLTVSAISIEPGDGGAIVIVAANPVGG